MCLFFFKDTATTEIYTYCHTLSLHDALPILPTSGPGTSGRVSSSWPSEPSRPIVPTSTHGSSTVSGSGCGMNGVSGQGAFDAAVAGASLLPQAMSISDMEIGRAHV